MNNKKLRRSLRKVEKDLQRQIGLFLSIPDKCIVCGAPFDKKSREQAMTWTVEVWNEDKRVDLYCPACRKAMMY